MATTPQAIEMSHSMNRAYSQWKFSYFAVALWLTVSVRAAVLSSDGSHTDVQAQINLAQDGDVVTLPAGSFTWTSGVTISGKAVHLKGQGAGNVLARSASPVAVGTGRKVFTLTSEGVAAMAARRLLLTSGTTVRVWRAGGDIDNARFPPFGVNNNLPWMEGKIAGLLGNDLALDVTSANSTGTHQAWIITTNATTSVTMNINADSAAGLSVTLPNSGILEISGIRFIGTANGHSYSHLCVIGGSAPFSPPLIHDCWFNTQQSGASALKFVVNAGIVWNCSFVQLPASLGNNSAIYIKSDRYGDSWSSPSTMGTADATGKRNIYIEDCYLDFYIDGIENDDNARVVIRNNLLSNCGIGAHGRDTSPYGMRHVEVYDNQFSYSSILGKSYNVQAYFIPRGGTGLFTGNIVEDIISDRYSDWGDRSEIILQIQQLGRSDAIEGGWGAGDGLVPQYPVPRQVGSGFIDGSRRDGKGRLGYNGLFGGDLEPLYIWGNIGFFPTLTLDIGADGKVKEPDRASDYIVAGRDYYIDGTVKPGWERYAYPHPLRSAPRFVQIFVAQQF